jgi:ParB family chromosome partitioning protein
MPKIGLDQIIDSENIRQNYADIEELADSIKKRGQLEPVIVKKADTTDDGTPRYELVAGFRRLKAIQMLNEKGEGFSQIKAEIVTGDRLTIQLIENLQRSDLSSIERERGIYLMTKNGLSQKEVAAAPGWTGNRSGKNRC